MAARTLYLFPDTNVFIQCKVLEEIDWRVLGDFNEVVLVVCRPVQDEIDRQKSGGGARLATRARAAHGLLRDILKSRADRLVRAAAPRVRLTMDLRLQPTPELADLNYDDADDALVGCAHAFSLLNTSADVRVLTDDGGPMAAANSIDFPFVDVPAEWTRPPEPTDTEKELAKERAENQRLRRAEPEIVVRALDSGSAEIDRIHVTHQTYSELSDVDIKSLMQKLKVAHPMATDFGPGEKLTRKLPGPIADIIGMTQVYEPASAEEVAAYRDKHYPRWLSSCQYVLRNLHFAMQARDKVPCVAFEATNVGTRPANSVMIEIAAQGSFEVMPPPRADDDGLVESAEHSLALPTPPEPPQGKWSQTLTGFGGYDAMPAWRAGVFGPDPITSLTRPNILDPARFIPPKRDPNDFYYKDRPDEPQASFALTCEQWRHASGPELFEVELHIDPDLETKGGGLLSFRVHADNLSVPSPKDLPVRITVQAANIVATAEALIDQLTPRVRAQKKS